MFFSRFPSRFNEKIFSSWRRPSCWSLGNQFVTRTVQRSSKILICSVNLEQLSWKKKILRSNRSRGKVPRCPLSMNTRAHAIIFQYNITYSKRYTKVQISTITRDGNISNDTNRFLVLNSTKQDRKHSHNAISYWGEIVSLIGRGNRTIGRCCHKQSQCCHKNTN